MKAISKLKDDARRHEQREEWEKAIQVYLQVLEISEAGDIELPLYNRIGDLCVRLGRPDDAVRYYVEAADRYAEAGLFNNAIALCNKALRYQPQQLPLLRKLGQFSASQGFLTDARRYYLEYAEKQFANKNIDAAVGALEDYLNVYDDVEARELLGRRLLAHGREAKGTEALRRAYDARVAAGEHDRAAALRTEIEAFNPGTFHDAAPERATPTADSTPVGAVERATDPLDPLDFEVTAPADDELNVVHEFGDSTAGILPIDPLEGLETDFDPDTAEPTAVEGLEPTTLDVGRASEGIEVQDLDIIHEESSFDLPLLHDPRDYDAGISDDDLPSDPSELPLLDDEPLPGLENNDLLPGFEGEPLPGLEDVLPGFDTEPLPGLETDPPGFDIGPLADMTMDSPAAEPDRTGFADLPQLEGLGDTDTDLFAELTAADLPLLEGAGDDDPMTDDGFTFALPALPADAEHDQSLPLDLRSPPGDDVQAGAAPADDATATSGYDLPETDADAAPEFLLPADVPEVEQELAAAVQPEAEEQPAEVRAAEAESGDPAAAERALSTEDARYIAALLADQDDGRGEPVAGTEPGAVGTGSIDIPGDTTADDVTLPAVAWDESDIDLVDAEPAPAPDEATLPPDVQVEDIAARDELAARAAHELADMGAWPPEPDVAAALPPEPDVAAALPPEPDVASVAAHDYVDLASLLAPDQEDTTRFQVLETDPTGDEDRDFAELLSQFRAKVSEHVPMEDAAAHYDLGLAFKEMGLIDEAIAEFQIALRVDHMRLKVCEELGHCFLQKEQYNIAEKVLRRALGMKHDDELELIGVYYHLGRAYEGMGRREDARDAYERVLGMDINFSDVSARLARL